LPPFLLSSREQSGERGALFLVQGKEERGKKPFLCLGPWKEGGLFGLFGLFREGLRVFLNEASCLSVRLAFLRQCSERKRETFRLCALSTQEKGCARREGV